MDVVLALYIISLAVKKNMHWEATVNSTDGWTLNVLHAVMAAVYTIPAAGHSMVYMLYDTGDNVLCNVLCALCPRDNPEGQIESINKD